MRKLKVLKWTVLTFVIIVGVFTIGTNLAHHFGLLNTCVAARTWSERSPGNSSVVRTTQYSCSRTQNEIRVNLDASGATYRLLWAIAPSSESEIGVLWKSPNSIEVRYARSMTVKFPAGKDEQKRYVYGDIDVTYTAM